MPSISLKFIAIAAMAQNRVIGSDGKIPWHIPDEFRWFKQKTMGGILVMGRKTYESIGRPLPGREIVVLSRSGVTFPGTRTVRELVEINPAVVGKTVFIAGGAEIYAQALPRCSDLFLTVVKREVGGDVFFPVLPMGFAAGEKIMDHPEFEVIHYRNSAAD